MTIPVLVVDASEQFGTLIRQTLEDTGYYQVTLVTNGAEAVKYSQSSDIRLAIVDFDLPDSQGPDIIRQLQATNDDLAVIAIPYSTEPDDPDMKDLTVDGLLSKPFYLPDLLKIVATALDLPDAPVSLAPSRPGPIGDEPARPSKSLAPWLTDVDQAAQYLTRLFLDVSAVAAMLTRDQRLWAYAGDLDQSQLKGLTKMIASYWKGKGVRGASVKFISFPESDDDFMLYSTIVSGDIILSLIFTAETSFSTIRHQAEHFSKTLAQVDPSEPSTDNNESEDTP